MSNAEGLSYMREERSVVVVTGGAGFIGSELVRQLAGRGERVLIVDNLVKLRPGAVVQPSGPKHAAR